MRGGAEDYAVSGVGSDFFLSLQAPAIQSIALRFGGTEVVALEGHALFNGLLQSGHRFGDGLTVKILATAQGRMWRMGIDSRMACARTIWASARQPNTIHTSNPQTTSAPSIKHRATRRPEAADRCWL